MQSAGIRPPIGHAPHTARCPRAAQGREQLFAGPFRPFSDHLHRPVCFVSRPADEAELARPPLHPPPEADALDVAGHGGRQPSGCLHQRPRVASEQGGESSRQEQPVRVFRLVAALLVACALAACSGGSSGQNENPTVTQTPSKPAGSVPVIVPTHSGTSTPAQ